MGLRDQLQAIYDDYGKLTPQLVVEEASKPDHPLHDRFEWDNELAANSWRLAQAHELIRRCKVVRRPADENAPEQTIRAFHAVRTEQGCVYEPVEKVAQDDFMRQLVLRDMEREWKQLHRRFKDFEEFVNMVRDDLDGQAA